MFVRLLGDVAWGEGPEGLSSAPGRVAAAVLAHLALAGGRVVPVDALVDAVWEEAPATARNAVQVAVSKLRKQAGTDLVDGSRVGYRLRTDLLRVDWSEAEQLLVEARRHLEGGRCVEASRDAEQALALFAGEPLGGLDAPAAAAARQRAFELRRSVVMTLARALLAQGRGEPAVELLRAEVDRDPFNEPAHALLMQGLAEEGRAADALAVYDVLRRRLAEELGTDPSPPVAAMFARVLAGDVEPVAAPSRAGLGPPPVKVSLPAASSPLLGRDDDVDRVVGLVTSGHRLVTLLGPGGIGKTRLAVEAARRIAAAQQRPAVLADLTLAREPGDVARVVADALDLDPDDITAGGLEGTRTLVVLDNAEHLLDAAAAAASSMLATDGVDVITTSRSPLRLRGERIVDVGGLAAETVEAPAVRLLIDRADLRPHEVAAQTGSLVALARRIDGVPLVVELVASALRWRTAQQVLDDLGEVLSSTDAFETDRPQRHASVASVVGWSVQQADPAARHGLDALTIIRGSFTETDAAAVLAAATPDAPPRTVLATLADLSLVQRLRQPGEVRFRILEPIRLYTVQSSPGLDPAVHRAHAEHYLALLEDTHRRIAESSNDFDTLVRQQHADLTQAITWTWTHDPPVAMHHLGPLTYGWYRRGLHDDVDTWTARALRSPHGTPHERVELAIVRLVQLGDQASPDLDEMHQLSQLIHPHADQLDDEWHRRWVHAEGTLCEMGGDFEGALRWGELHRPLTPLGAFSLRLHRGLIFCRLGRWQDAYEEMRVAVNESPSEGHDSLRTYAMANLGYAALAVGDFAAAERALADAFRLAVRSELAAELTVVETNMAWLAIKSGQPEKALDQIATTISQPRGRRDSLGLSEMLLIAGLALHELGRPEPAHTVAAGAIHHAEQVAGLSDALFQAAVDQLNDAVGFSDPPGQRPSVDELVDVIQNAARDLNRS